MIGVLIPAYNAEATVGEVIAGVLTHLPRVLVVDDGSSDATARRAEAAGAEVIRHDGNRGKGAALGTGFARLREQGVEAVITIDADMQHDPEDIPILVESFQTRRADLIIGSRESSFSAMTPGRRFGNRFSCGALKFFSGLELTDSQSGFRLYSREFLDGLSLKRTRYDAEIEAILRAGRDRRRIETVQIGMKAADGSATSYFRPWLDTYRICRTVVWFSVCEIR
ncbi:MAG TPA: glycosyltransferase family 2 protein [Candidatus Polarisedimenticolia bacterium]|nr:glycosyltransferase family 2 protein [Candidatus Polarisedimenticolia bacterium]